MDAYEILSLRERFVARSLVVLWCFVAPACCDAQSTADEVLEKMLEVMAPPIQYRLKSSEFVDGAELVVSQKMLADGTLASHLEYPMPIASFVMLCYKSSSFIYFPAERVAIDRSFRIENDRNHATDIANAFLNASGGASRGSANLLQPVNRDGIECVQVEVLSGSLSSSFDIPFRQVLVIERGTSILVENHAFTEAGDAVSSKHFSEVQLNPELSDEFFQVPEDTRIMIPDSPETYIEMYDQVVKMNQAERLSPVLPPLVSEPLPRGPPPRPSREELRDLLEERRYELDRDSGPSKTNEQRYLRLAFVAVNIFIAIGLMAYTWRRWRHT